MRHARSHAGTLAECLESLLDEEGDAVDRRAAVFVIAESILMWRKSVSK